MPDRVMPDREADIEYYPEVEAERDEALAEVERLRRENEQLRARPQHNHPDPGFHGKRCPECSRQLEALNRAFAWTEDDVAAVSGSTAEEKPS